MYRFGHAPFGAITVFRLVKSAENGFGVARRAAKPRRARPIEDVEDTVRRVASRSALAPDAVFNALRG